MPVTRSETFALARSSATRHPALPVPATKASPPRLPTDNISHWTAPPSVVARGPDSSKFNALSRSEPWVPHTSNEAGARSAVYDPIAHITTVFTFDGRNGVSRREVGSQRGQQCKHKPVLRRYTAAVVRFTLGRGRAERRALCFM
jgi:hypothetical protein